MGVLIIQLTPQFMSNFIIILFQMKKVIPSDAIQMSLSNISTIDAIPTSTHLECRFCKQNETPQNSSSSFLSPCSCVEPIHSYCLSDEMQKNTRGQIISAKAERQYTCQRCQKNIRFTIQATRECRSREELGQFAAKRKCFCFWLVLCMLVMLGLLVFVVIIKTTPSIEWVAMSNIVLIALAIIAIVLFLVSSFFCLTEVIFQEKRRVSLLNSHTKQRRKYSNRLEIVDCA